MANKITKEMYYSDVIKIIDYKLKLQELDFDLNASEEQGDEKTYEFLKAEYDKTQKEFKEFLEKEYTK